MGSKGDARDNAVAESFFASLSKDLLRRRSFRTRHGRPCSSTSRPSTDESQVRLRLLASFARVGVVRVTRELKRRRWGCLLPRCLSLRLT
jgi:hypothetical protein